MNRILIARLSALGDVVCTLPVAVAIERTWPEAEIVWAVDPRFRGVVDCCSAVDSVVPVKPSWRSRPTFPGEFDAALDMQGLLKSALCVAGAEAKTRLGYHWQREGSWWFSAAVKPDPTSLHIVDQYVDVARALGAEGDRAEFGLVPWTEDQESVAAKLRAIGVSGPYALANAGAGWPTKRWPAASFAALSDRLPVPLVFIGGPGTADREALADVQAAAKNPVLDVLGQTSVRELVALVAGAQAHVGGDPGGRGAHRFGARRGETPSGALGRGFFQRHAELLAVQPCVQAVIAQQFEMASALGDHALFQHHDLVGIDNRAEPVGDDEGRSPLHQAVERALYERFGLAV
jgi:ADP-heptose:LPS heptosyltransferase